MNTTDDADALYSIGAVAKLTGVTASTLRTWERRHEALMPTRTPAGGRRYTEADVERVQLLATLTQAGESIGVIAGVETETLRRRVDALPKPMRPSPPSARLFVLHRSLGASLAAAEHEDFELALSVDTLEGISLPRVDVALVEYGLLGSDPVTTLGQVYAGTGASLVVVEYTFARRAPLRALTEAGGLIVRGPLSVTEALHIVRRHHRHPSALRGAPATPDDAAEINFTREQLARLRELVPHNPCECPHHLAQLVLLLQEFEAYCRGCVSQNRRDAALHGAMEIGTGRARSVMEALLAELCEHEGIEV